MTANDILTIAVTVFFASIFAASIYAFLIELARDIEPYSKGD